MYDENGRQQDCLSKAERLAVQTAFLLGSSYFLVSGTLHEGSTLTLDTKSVSYGLFYLVNVAVNLILYAVPQFHQAMLHGEFQVSIDKPSYDFTVTQTQIAHWYF